MINCVVSRYKKNVDWVYKLRNINKFYIYDKEMPENEYNIPVNKGNEASVYLKYIIDNYDNLSDFTFFIHDDEYAWHHSGSIIDLLDEAVISNKLYYNINANSSGSMNTVFSHNTDFWVDGFLDWYNMHIEMYVPYNTLDLDKIYRTSAQFLVHKSLITKLPLEFYEKLYNWIITTDMISAKSGRFLEWTWHIFFDIYPNL
ncbi:MAG: DUF3431 domain-containing protein [Alphaproteobacteria bacterium]|uniref:Glycosyltransferase n=1 Tax=viral metagenome TaxID=1070528 RepID=A0A6C0HPX6_9ZZZZ|nr:DUF3431 domain-containing protein [Alphaproteobacteria bacterium]